VIQPIKALLKFFQKSLKFPLGRILCVAEIFLAVFFVNIQGVSAKTFEPNISVICQRIFMEFKMQIF
jgi:hypothetical protein